MISIIDINNPDYQDRWQEFLSIDRGGGNGNNASSDITAKVADIIQQVRNNGDRALVEYSSKLDNYSIDNIEELRVASERIHNAWQNCPDDVKAALQIAFERITIYHQKQIPDDFLYNDELGNQLGWRWQAISSVGIYVPGGTASYPSSVLMNAIPAKVAGVNKITMMVPAPAGKLNDIVLAAAYLCGIDEIWCLGGAQAVAALAYGTESIQPVDKIVGPGNAWVAEAKRQVFGKVGIDSIAGPSEIMVVADETADIGWVAADLLSQAEHDKLAQSVLITDNINIAHNIINEITKQIEKLPRKDIALSSWKDYGCIIVVNDLLNDTPSFINDYAPEHLELMMQEDKYNKLMPNIRNAGAIFLGHYTPEAMGDYIAGPSHVLPTSHTAKYASGLSVFDFKSRSSIIKCSQEGFLALSGHVIDLAQSEGLTAHANSVKSRIGTYQTDGD